MIDFIQDITQKAGEVLLSHFREDDQLVKQRSSAKEAVTKYDKMVDELVVNAIKGRYPNHSLLTEESGLIKGDPDWLWIVDALDGTADFANENPMFAVCIAVMHKGELHLGTVYAPAIDEFYFAERGKGAYLNHKKISVSETAELKKSYLFYCEGGESDRLRTARLLGQVYPEVKDIRKLGTAGLETAWVAAGKGEAYFTTKIEPWDVAPGVLLVEEAGGQVTDFEGKPWKLKTSDLVFSNRRVHQTVLKLLRP